MRTAGIAITLSAFLCVVFILVREQRILSNYLLYEEHKQFISTFSPSLLASLMATTATAATLPDKDDAATATPLYVHSETSQQCSLVLNYILSGSLLDLQPVYVHTPGKVDFSKENNQTNARKTTANDAFAQKKLLKASIPSINHLWETRIHPQMVSTSLNWTHQNLEWNAKFLNYTKMEEDFSKVYNEFTVPRLRKSLLHPMDGNQMSRILRIIELRLTDPDHNPPLQIMIFGGSVVTGHASGDHQWHINGSQNRMGKNAEVTSWPSQMQRIWNEVVFAGKDAVRVTNMASGGTTSDVGAMALEYGLFPPEHPPPDVIIHAYANNDMVTMTSTDEDSVKIVEQFIVAAKKVRCDALPAVVLYDDLMGVHGQRQRPLHFMMTYLRTVSQLSSWYNLMAVSYASAFRHTIYSADGKALKVSSDLPMLAGQFQALHPGMVYHLSAAWTLVYGFISDMIESCNDYKTLITHKESYSEMPIDGFPTLSESTNTTLTNLQDKWKENVRDQQLSCATATSSAERPCDPRSWIVHKVGGFQRGRALKVALRRLHSNVKHWFVEGTTLVKKPRPGWVAAAANASFEAILDGHQTGIKYVTILSMKSYGDKWEGSRLKVTFWDMGMEGKADIKTKKLLGEYFIDGFHNSPTSVYFPHKLLLGNAESGGIPRGHWLKAMFALVGGTTFRIQGILYCSR